MEGTGFGSFALDWVGVLMLQTSISQVSLSGGQVNWSSTSSVVGLIVLLYRWDSSVSFPLFDMVGDL